MSRKRVDAKDKPIAIVGCIGFDMKDADGKSPRCTKEGELLYCEKAGSSFGQPFTTHAWMCEKHREFFGYRVSQPALSQ